ncbi:MAG: isochorismatase [Gemmatimonadota bacterium]|nr:isochorismatase [Gemmatimonadota bacterium]
MSGVHYLPIPQYFDRTRVGEVWRVAYETRASEAHDWAQQHGIEPAASDEYRLCLLLIDCQNTFCVPEFELFVGGRSGKGAVEDNIRLCEFIYRNLSAITEIVPTMDTHTAIQIFHPIFWVNEAGEHPVGARTVITPDDLERGVWRINPDIVGTGENGGEWLQAHANHYVRQLGEGRYPLMVWPYHALLGGIGHALVSSVEEAIFTHSIARCARPRFEVKGGNPLTENYSVLSPEVCDGPDGQRIAAKNTALIDHLLGFDVVVVAGQAKSHCVAWTVHDLLSEIRARDPQLAHRVYLLEDCTSPVVVPGVVDFSEPANAAFREFAEAGMHCVQSTRSLVSWPGVST